MGAEGTGEVLTLSQAATFNQDHLIIVEIFVVSSQIWPVVLNNLISHIIFKLYDYIASKTYFTMLWERVNFLQRLGQSANQTPAVCWLWTW